MRQPRRLFLYALGAFGAAGVAVLLSSGTAHAQTPTVPVAPVPVRAPVPAAPRTVNAVVRETVRTLPSQPSTVPIVGEVVEPVLDAAPITLPVVPDVLPLRALRTVEAPIAPSSTDRLRPAPVISTASRSLAPSRARAQGRDRVRPVTATSDSAPSAPARPSGGGVPPFDSHGGPPGVTADAQTHGSGGRAAASMAAVARAVASGWSRFDFASSRAPRPGIAFDLSPPG